MEHTPIVADKLLLGSCKLVDGIREIISTTRFMVQDKNSNELFQNFVWDTRDVDIQAGVGQAERGDACRLCEGSGGQ